MAVSRNDVARLAGTSPAVVSYVLNDGPRTVAPHTRARVLAAVRELDYRPNRIARSLRTSRTMTLGLVVPDTSNPFFAELARAVEEEAFASGYTLLLGNATDDEDRQTTYIRTFLDRQVDGLLLIPSHSSVVCLAELERSGVPWVVLDRRLSEPAASQVIVDNLGGGAAATRHLLGHGCRRIACLAGPPDAAPTAERIAGWRSALGEAGMDPGGMPLRHASFGRYAGYRGARDLLAEDRGVDAIFAISDDQAVGVLCALTELGLRCPDDVAVASFDGIPAAAYTIPALTTVRQPFADLGRTAVRLFTERINEPERDLATVVLPVALVIRRSCGCTYSPAESDRT